MRFGVLIVSVFFCLSSSSQPSYSTDAKSEEAYQAGAALMLKRKPKLALPQLSRAIQLDPTHGDAYLERAHAYLMLEDAQHAVSDASTAIRLLKHDAGRARGYLIRARGQVELSKFKEAKDDFSKAIQLNRDPATTWILYEFRAKTCLLLNDEKSAFSDFTNSIRSSPKGNYGPYFHRGNILLKQRKYKEAIEDYTNALKYRPADENIERIYSERARAYEGIGRKDLAAKDREKIKKSASDWELYLEDPSPKQK